MLRSELIEGACADSVYVSYYLIVLRPDAFDRGRLSTVRIYVLDLVR